MRIKKIFSVPLLVMVLLGGLSACSDSHEEAGEFDNWKARNEAHLAIFRTEVLDSISQARQRYGDAWESRCNYRAYKNYALESEGLATTAFDSVFVKILRRGSGTASPYINDSVRVFYRGTLIPSVSYPEGFVFAHSGQSSIYSEIFNPRTAVPATIRNSSFVKGFSTALLHMHIGDRWRVYIPYKSAYDTDEKTGIPAYSNLIFDIELVQFFRSGSTVTPW